MILKDIIEQNRYQSNYSGKKIMKIFICVASRLVTNWMHSKCLADKTNSNERSNFWYGGGAHSNPQHCDTVITSSLLCSVSRWVTRFTATKLRTKAPHLLLTCCSPLFSFHGTLTHGTALVHIIHKCRAHTAAIVPRSEAGLSPVFSANPLSCSKQTKKKKCCWGDKASCYTKVMDVEETAILHVERTGFSHDIFPPLPLTL